MEEQTLRKYLAGKLEEREIKAVVGYAGAQPAPGFADSDPAEFNRFAAWAWQVYAWQCQANDAIHALEGGQGAGKPNPEDPPPPPWKPKG